MREQKTEQLTLEAAARILYGVKQPTPEQVWQVRQKLKSNALSGSQTGTTWTVSTQSLATYLARSATAQTSAAEAAASHSRSATSQQSAELRTIYRDIFRDYFLAVMLRKRKKGQSRAFGQAVLAGQILLLAGVALLLGAAIRGSLSTMSAEQRAIQQWIATDAGRFEFISWSPPRPAADGQGMVVPVNYRFYTLKGKGIETRRLFTVVNKQVARVDSDEGGAADD